MTTGQARWVVWVPLLAIACAVLSGCAQGRTLGGRRTTLAALKTTVSQLQFENGQLRRELADVQTANRRLENRLAQEEAANGELAARLDDARNLLRDRGYELDATRELRAEGGDPRSSTSTVPAGRSSPPGRRPPFARIPGRIDPAPGPDLDDAFPPFDDDFTTPRRPWRSGRDVGPQSWIDRASPWLPVARGLGPRQPG